MHLAFAPPPGAELGVGDDVLDGAVSADGTEIVFVATADGVTRLWHRRLSSERAEPLEGTEGAAMPAWKSTRVVSFFADGKLKQLSLTDRSVRDLAEAPAPAGAAWLEDGSLLFVPDARGPVRRLREGVVTDATRLGAGDRGHAYPAVADAGLARRSRVGGGGFTYVASVDAGRRVVRLVTKDGERELSATSSHAQLFPTHLLHARDGTLVAQRFDAELGTLDAQLIPLAFGVGVSPSGRGFFAASATLLVWAAAAERGRELAWFDFDGTRLGSVGEPDSYAQVRLSPDDGAAAVTMPHPLLRTLDIFVIPMRRPGDRTQLTLAVAADSHPVWAPGGDRVLFRSIQRGQPNLFVRRLQASDDEEEPAFTSELDETPSDWRGGTVLFHAAGEAGLDVWALDLASGTRTPATRQGFNKYDARWSPDGRRIAYVSDEFGRPEIYVEPSPPTGRRVRVSLAGGIRPEWGRDGRTLFFLRDGRVMRSSTAGAPARPLPGIEGVRDYSVAHRSNRILAIVPRARTEIPVAGVILNWKPEVPRRPRQRF
jgi:hypothetical protein